MARLEAADDLLQELVGVPGTLAPDRSRATPLLTLGKWWLAEHVPALAVLAEGLYRLVEEQAVSFPGNLFWDHDQLVASLASDVRSVGPEADRYLAGTFESLVRIHRLFGARMPIRFRYVHDFNYGFDWAKWVQRKPTERCHHGPFSRAFLEAIEARGGELLDRIADDDPEYPEVSEGESRNPFPFRRDPAAETLIFRDLAERGYLPLCAWDRNAEADWTRPYQSYREERALALGLAIPVGGSDR